jgi:hypothetical protein
MLGEGMEGRWVPGRRLNGDEGHPSLRSGSIRMLKIRLYKSERHDPQIREEYSMYHVPCH